jgi:hypothetical protein
MLVLEATGNSKVAMDILSGTYKEPDIYPDKIGRWETKKEKVLIDGVETEVETKIPIMYHLESYNAFTKEVSYYYTDSWKRTNTMSLESWANLEYPWTDNDQVQH